MYYARRCVAASGTDNTAQVFGRMDSIKYQQILEANVTQSVKKLKLKRAWLLQQHNDPKHTSKSTMNYFRKCNLTILVWPSQSTDLNMFKNLWISMLCM